MQQGGFIISIIYSKTTYPGLQCENLILQCWKRVVNQVDEVFVIT